MNINITLFGQMITFALFIFVTMKYVWPPMMTALENRRKIIAEGLEAAERGKKDLELAQEKISQQLKETKQEVASIIEDANRRGTKLVEEAKDTARIEGDRILALAKADIDNEFQGAKDKLASHVSEVALEALEKVLRKQVDKDSNSQLINELIEEI